LRVGVTVLYSWRPHVEQAEFLCRVLENAGHEVHVLVCDSNLSNCYTRELRGRSRARECLACVMGGMRSYRSARLADLGSIRRASPSDSELWELTRSSASTLKRFEAPAEYASAEFGESVARLSPAAGHAYGSSKIWIERNCLQSVIVFNGRIDITRAAFQSALDMSVPAVSMERTWFGDGIQLLPNENCLGLKTVGRMVAEWRCRPLAEEQALKAAALVARRFSGAITTEWRNYGLGAEVPSWQVPKGCRKVLLVPSSLNEVWGHPDWDSAWERITEGFDSVIDRFGLKSEELILRCHPNWSERIGRNDGRHSEAFYSAWAAARGIRCIASAARVSTLGLIEQADAVVVTNGSAAVDAGLLGKQVIAICPSVYSAAEIADNVGCAADLEQLELWGTDPGSRRSAGERADVVRNTLRFLYAIAYRVPQYCREVVARTTTQYVFADADPGKLSSLLETGTLEADDNEYAASQAGEDQVIGMLAAREWEHIIKAVPARDISRHKRILRRPAFRLVDAASRWKGVGDR
jgi:hypothetical protein